MFFYPNPPLSTAKREGTNTLGPIEATVYPSIRQNTKGMPSIPYESNANPRASIVYGNIARKQVNKP